MFVKQAFPMAHLMLALSFSFGDTMTGREEMNMKWPLDND